MKKIGRLKKMALTKTQELRKKAQALLAQAKKIEEESFTKLGVVAAKYFAGEIEFAELKAKAEELGFEIERARRNQNDPFEGVES